MTMRRAYIGLGANLGEPARQVRDALDAIALRFPMLARSPLYRSRAIGLAGQPDYCNAACCVALELEPQVLMDALLEIERAAGRVRDGRKWGPRLLDLDLLHVEGVVMESASLTLPHPEVHRRNFVLRPLADIEPGLFIPGVGVVSEAVAGAGADGLSAWADK
ncbi:MAG TPA: 2-amino-4-hydroxy-6-hydroxymethyldihydropteridine diphosphokinase [Solimonas sp.]|nr:2-amino-4-hydroxy-6-hydroxymethyldihydropteridine diphosphokinase [Solimonas sp.]